MYKSRCGRPVCKNLYLTVSPTMRHLHKNTTNSTTRNPIRVSMPHFDFTSLYTVFSLAWSGICNLRFSNKPSSTLLLNIRCYNITFASRGPKSLGTRLTVCLSFFIHNCIHLRKESGQNPARWAAWKSCFRILWKYFSLRHLLYCSVCSNALTQRCNLLTASNCQTSWNMYKALTSTSWYTITCELPL